MYSTISVIQSGALTYGIVRVFSVDYGQVGPRVAIVCTPLQHDVHVSVFRARLGVLTSAFGKGEQRAFRGEQERRNSETVVVQITGLEDIYLKNWIDSRELFGCLQGVAVERRQSQEEQQSFSHARQSGENPYHEHTFPTRTFALLSFY